MKLNRSQVQTSITTTALLEHTHYFIMSYLPYSRSIVPVDGPVRYLYNLANRTGYEHKSVKFWSLWLQYEGFPERDWLVTTEQPPDGSESRRRVDIVIDKYDPNEDTLSSVVWVEAKKPGGDYNTVYLQGLDAGQRAIDYEGLYGVYVVTTGIAAIKGSPPFRVAPTIPSQPLPAPDAQETPGHDAWDGTEVVSDEQTWTSQDDNGQGMSDEQGQSYGQVPQDEGHGQQEPDPGPSGAGGLGGSTASTKYHKVQVVKKGFLGNDYCFQDHRGKERKTKKADWAKGKYKVALTGVMVSYKGGWSTP
ncbi:hypothetical protein CDV31_015481 [Fusarium ambrosium]|uniref:Uncharacterized protein n=1 Tax=Fusarium ambrosium TaxID=131363 RepID=A0A428SNE9_9HYPO|nr:hypothetical protein CDV31_015481 [Fusarium ambrosium]